MATSGRNDDAMPLRAALCVATAVALASIVYRFLRFGKRVHVVEAGQHAHHANHEEDAMLEVEYALWSAALRGDAHSMRHLLHTHDLPADTPHPRTGSTLLLDVAAAHTRSTQHDMALAGVMAALLQLGASRAQQSAPAGDTVMHLLVEQPEEACVHARVMFLLREWTVGGDVVMLNMLRVRNAAGILPAEAAAAAGRVDHRALIDLVASPEAFVALEAAGGGGEP